LTRVLAIGDVHGCTVAFDTLLSAVDLQPEDTLVMLGDYGDRGPDTKGVFDRLLILSRNHHIVALRGNHEQMMLSARANHASWLDWEKNGGNATLRSYGSLNSVPPEHWDFIQHQCLDYWECDTHFFVHGNVYPNVPLWEQPTYKLYWGRFDDAKPHESGKIMVCGHSSQKNGLPRNFGYAVCLDTWVYGAGWLTCMDISTGRIWQADQSGQQRNLSLSNIIDVIE
jgi:serine/threonine protein phosphatase 1